MQGMLIDAKVRMCKAQRSWALVYGHAASFVATTARLGRVALSAGEIMDDIGRQNSMVLNSPAVIEHLVYEAVGRWVARRLVRINKRHGVEVEGLEAMFKINSGKGWGPGEVAALRPTCAGSQWPRIFAESGDIQ